MDGWMDENGWKEGKVKPYNRQKLYFLYHISRIAAQNRTLWDLTTGQTCQI